MIRDKQAYERAIQRHYAATRPIHSHCLCRRCNKLQPAPTQILPADAFDIGTDGEPDTIICRDCQTLAAIHARGDRTAPDGTPLCSIHNVPMRPSKFGGWYCMQQMDDGSGKPVYCKAKA